MVAQGTLLCDPSHTETKPELAPGVLLPTQMLCGRENGHVSRSTVRTKMTKVCKDAKITRFTPHDMKRTFVTRMSELKVEKHVIMAMSAHSTEQMLYHYDDVHTQRKAEAVDLLLDEMSKKGQGLTIGRNEPPNKSGDPKDRRFLC